MLGGFEGFGLGAEQFILALQLFFFKPFFCRTELEVMGDDLRGGSAFLQLLLRKVDRERDKLILPRFGGGTRTESPLFSFGKIRGNIGGVSWLSFSSFWSPFQRNLPPFGRNIGGLYVFTTLYQPFQEPAEVFLYGGGRNLTRKKRHTKGAKNIGGMKNSADS